MNSEAEPDETLPSRAEQKAALQTLRASKKLKNIDNSSVAKNARMTTFRNQWLIDRSKATPETKAHMKKVAGVKKKLLKR